MDALHRALELGPHDDVAGRQARRRAQVRDRLRGPADIREERSDRILDVRVERLDKERRSHIGDFNLDEALGLFAGRNVLPKQSFATDYSYRTGRDQQQALLPGLAHVFHKSFSFKGLRISERAATNRKCFARKG